jgi:DNA-binding MarR family transcriptional regulator
MQLSEINRSVADRLHSAAIHLLRRLRRQDEGMGLTPARASALSILVFGGPVTMTALARAEQVSAPTITRLVVGMEKDGLLRREPDARDGRVVWLHPTAKGTRLLHDGRRQRVAALTDDLAILNPAERETLGAAADIIERMLAARHVARAASRESTAHAARMRRGRRSPGGATREPAESVNR